MEVQLTPASATPATALTLRLRSRAHAAFEVRLNGEPLLSRRYPIQAVDPVPTSVPRRDALQAVQGVADARGDAEMVFYLPPDTPAGAHLLSVEDFSTPRRRAYLPLQVMEEGQTGPLEAGPDPASVGSKGANPGEHTAEDLTTPLEAWCRPATFSERVAGSRERCAHPERTEATSRPTLAASSWPTIYHDPHLTKLMDLDGDYKNDDLSGPTNSRSGTTYYQVVIKWRAKLLGLCISNVSQGTDDSLYYAVSVCNLLLKLHPTTGRVLRCYQGFKEGILLVNQPMVLQENGYDRIYLAVTGNMLKFNTDLKLLASSPTLTWTNPYAQEETNELLAAVCTYSNAMGAIIFVAQGAANLKPMPGTVLYALRPDNLTIIDSVDVASDLHNDFDLPNDSNYPSFIATNNTASICSQFNPDGSLSAEELVFVLLQQRYLLAYRLGLNPDTGDAEFRGRKWPSVNEEWLKGTASPAAGTDPPGFYWNKQAGTSPTVSPDGRRVYICSGIWTPPAPEDEHVPPYVKPRLYAFDTQTGASYHVDLPDRYYYFASDTSNTPSDPPLDEDPAAMDGKSISSPACTFDVDRGLPMIYVSIKDGGIYGYCDTGSSLYLRWMTDPAYTSYGMNSAVAGKYYYAPFYLGSQRGTAYAGGFSTLSIDCNPNGICTGNPATPNWRIVLNSKDICVRTVTRTKDGKTQVYFGTTTDLYCFESKAVPLSPQAGLRFNPFSEVAP